MSPEATAFAYYPGCMAGETAREYDASIQALAKLAGITLGEIDDWNCCGAGILQDVDPKAAAALGRRNLDRAPDGRVIVSGCPLCVARLQETGSPEGATHVLGIFGREDVREKLAEKIEATGEKRPLGSMKVACYYGRALAEPALWGGGEGPWPMETLAELAGASVVKWGGGRRPSGGYRVFARPEEGFGLLEKIFRDFEKSGADAIVTADPHAHFNLDSFQYTIGRRRRRALEVPVFHFTELLGLAMNIEMTEKWLSRHVACPFPLIDRLVAGEENRKRAEARRKRRQPKKEKERE